MVPARYVHVYGVLEYVPWYSEYVHVYVPLVSLFVIGVVAEFDTAEWIN